jgi:hypothetical protein
MDVETGHRVHKPPTKMHPFVFPFYHQVKMKVSIKIAMFKAKSLSRIWPFFGELWGCEGTLEHWLGSWGSSMPTPLMPLGWEDTSFSWVLEHTISE